MGERDREETKCREREREGVMSMIELFEVASFGKQGC